MRRKRPELWSIGNWLLHHDNAPAHSSHLIQTFLVFPVVCKTSYSFDMASCDFGLFPKFKRPLKGKRFQTREDIMTAKTAELNTIPQEAFSECFQQWRHCWENCVKSQCSRYACFFPAARKSISFLTDLVLVLQNQSHNKYHIFVTTLISYIYNGCGINLT